MCRISNTYYILSDGLLAEGLGAEETDSLFSFVSSLLTSNLTVLNSGSLRFPSLKLEDPHLENQETESSSW